MKRSDSKKPAGQNAILLRVGCDSGAAGGGWNAPIDRATGRYVYVPIRACESEWDHICPAPTYQLFRAAVEDLGEKLPRNLSPQDMAHVDPDFETLSHGESHPQKNKRSPRFNNISKIKTGDLIVFYGSFRPCGSLSRELVYSLIGLFHVERVCQVKDLTLIERKLCAHGRRKGKAVDNDLVFWGRRTTSGRFSKAIEIGRKVLKSYRVRPDMTRKWGGLSHGYLQRSFNPPWFQNPAQFLAWLKHEMRMRRIQLVRTNV